MGRTLLIAAVSLSVGAGLTYLLLPAPETRYLAPSVGHDGGTPVGLDEPSSSAGTKLALAPLLDGPFGVAERAAVYGVVADAGLETLKSMARDLWAADSSMGTDFALEAIVSRMTEIDGNAGIDLIREANPDAEQMLAAALAVIASRGVTARNMESIVAALPRLDERRFKTETLRRLAGIDPEQATSLAVGVRGQALRIDLLREIAMVWSARDFTAARAAMADIVDGDDRAAFEAGLTTRRVQTDPEKVLFDAIGSSTARERQFEVALSAREVAKTDPRRALELADRLEGEPRAMALRAAIQTWGSDDAYAALGLVERVGPGRDRDTLMQAIGEELGRQDPDGALAWFDSLGTSPPGLYDSILRGIAQSNPQRAMELAADSDDPSDLFLTARAFRSGNVAFADLANRVLATDTSAGREARVQMLVDAWANDDPEEALSWLVSHREEVGHEALRAAAETVARENPDAAIRATQLLPIEDREDWVRAVASGYAESDPAGARTWVERFRGESAYEAGMTAVVQTSAMRDPAGAAELLPRLAETAARDRAATTVAQQWAAREPAAARDWATTLPKGPLRDAALTGVMMTSDELPDATALARFQSDQARQLAILHVASRRAQVNIDDAHAMVERHIHDPSLRMQAEQMLESSRNDP
jgi:hypothetical protein